MDSMSTTAWETTRAKLVAFVARRVENNDVAEDIVQDVLERYHRADRTQVANSQQWLYRAARNAIIDHYRRRKPQAGIDEVAGDLVAPEEIEEVPVAEQELAQCLRPLVDALPDKYRDAVTLVDLDGYTNERAAELRGLSVSGMKSRVQRGRIQLADVLHDCCVFETDRRGSVIDYTPREPSCEC